MASRSGVTARSLGCSCFEGRTIRQWRLHTTSAESGSPLTILNVSVLRSSIVVPALTPPRYVKSEGNMRLSISNGTQAPGTGSNISTRAVSDTHRHPSIALHTF
eukprot:GFYU01080789.1.p1 GENE.GFYU01080789.1~~GFYU01080789.1.p1  ORF type:complete len:104 (+),score=4.83 GFYU01080789.1:69-380(+)